MRQRVEIANPAGVRAKLVIKLRYQCRDRLLERCVDGKQALFGRSFGIGVADDFARTGDDLFSLRQHRHARPLAVAPGCQPTHEWNVALFLIGNAMIIERPARFFAIVTKRNRDEHCRHRYHTVQASLRTILSPGLHENAAANSGKLESGPLTRNFAGECGSVATRRRAYSSRRLMHQVWA